MCPNCIKGLKNGELCEQCKGTGFWNPESLSVKDVEVMNEHEQATAPEADIPAPAEIAAPEVTVTTPEVEVSASVETSPSEDAGVQTPAPEEVKSEDVVA